MKIKRPVLVVSLILVVVSLFAVAAMIYRNSVHGANGAVDSSALIRIWSPVTGNPAASVVVVEFLDPECESCRAFHPVVKAALKRHDGKIKYVVRYMPFHNNSMIAIRWLEAARRQNRYWEALDLVFEKQPQWGDHAHPRPELLETLMLDPRLGLDLNKLKLDILDPVIQANALADQKDGLSLGVKWTPTIFVNGVMLDELSEEKFNSLIESQLP